MDSQAEQDGQPAATDRWERLRTSSNVLVRCVAYVVLAVLVATEERNRRGREPSTDAAIRRAYEETASPAAPRAPASDETPTAGAGSPGDATPPPEPPPPDASVAASPADASVAASPADVSVAASPADATADAIADAAAGATADEQQVRQVEQELAREQQRYDRREAEVRRQDTIVFTALVATGIAASLLVLLAVVLALLGLAPVGVVTAVVALLPGGGAVLLARQRKGIREKEVVLEREADDNRRVLMATRAALMIPDSAERTVAMADLAAQHLQRIRGS